MDINATDKEYLEKYAKEHEEEYLKTCNEESERMHKIKLGVEQIIKEDIRHRINSSMIDMVGKFVDIEFYDRLHDAMKRADMSSILEKIEEDMNDLIKDTFKNKEERIIKYLRKENDLIIKNDIGFVLRITFYHVREKRTHITNFTWDGYIGIQNSIKISPKYKIGYKFDISNDNTNNLYPSVYCMLNI